MIRVGGGAKEGNIGIREQFQPRGPQGTAVWA